MRKKLWLTIVGIVAVLLVISVYWSLGLWASKELEPENAGTGWTAVAGAATGVATVALVVVTMALWRATDRMQADSRDRTFMDVHLSLLRPDLQRGRRSLHNDLPADVGEAAAYFADGAHDEEYDQMNAALAAFDAASFYAEKGYINREDFQTLWGQSLARISAPARVFIEVRKEQTGWEPWEHLRNELTWAEERHANIVRRPPTDDRPREAED